LTDKNFTSVTDRGDWLVRFCIKGDSQCEETQPKWRALEDQPAFSRLAEVDCEQSPETCKKERIQKYPFYILYNDQVLPHGANRLPNVPESEELPYTHFLEQWTIMTIRGNIKTLSVERYKETIESHEMLIVYMNGYDMDCRDFWLEYRAIANVFGSSLRPLVMAKVECNGPTAVICENENIKSLPTVVYMNHPKDVRREYIPLSNNFQFEYRQRKITAWVAETRELIGRGESHEELDEERRKTRANAKQIPAHEEL